MLAHNWYYYIYNVNQHRQVVFVYVFHTKINPFFPELGFAMSRRCIIDTTSYPVKDFVHRYKDCRRMYCEIENFHPCFVNEVHKRSSRLYRKHSFKDLNEESLFIYDNYAVFMYSCPPRNKPKLKKKLIVIAEDGGKTSPGTRGHGVLSISTTSLVPI
jgi:hypothetical protein